MKAVTFHERGGPEVLRYEELPQPKIGPGEVLVQVRACALNHLDIFTRQGKQGVKAKLPHVGGLETAGVIAEAAPDAQNVRAGERVLVTPFVVCGQCEYCRADLENLCENRTIIGVQAHGGFADLRPAGRLVTCGGTTGRWGQTDIWSLFGKQLSLLGSFGAVQSDFETVLELVGKGIFQPIISQVFPLAETARAQAEIEDRKHFGKVMVVPEN